MKYLQLLLKNKIAILAFFISIALAIVIISVSGFTIKDGDKEFKTNGLLKNKMQRIIK